MIKYETSTTIEQPASAVFEVLLDAARWEQWTDMTEVTLDAAGRPGLGSRGSFRFPGGPFKGLVDTEIVEFEPGRRIVFRCTHPALTWIAYAETRPDGDRTLFVYGGEMTIHGWRRLLEPMLRSEVEKGEAAEAQRLKALLEAEAPIAVPA
ncbi:MAG TPA: SRPBCC family protein [Candidatus Deferrimicrobiaceae bacterium]|nr:SRPBCC family protein [Candidatus Deferrimicrobiaceae bacterium]